MLEVLVSGNRRPLRADEALPLVHVLPQLQQGVALAFSFPSEEYVEGGARVTVKVNRSRRLKDQLYRKLQLP